MKKRDKTENGKRIFLKKCQEEEIDVSIATTQRPWESKSGRLFVRNLAYTATDEELETLFGKYGPMTECNLPVDSQTKKIKGFAHVTYMMPEHAVKAYSELDGTIFMVKGSSYKNLKKTKQKSMAASAHNWNTLFLGANAVADVMAEKYGTSKSQILDAESKQSLGVRMALGETQLVSETRDFLLENGVSLDSFSQFQHVPLYLEWAPVDVFMKKSEKNETEKDKKEEEANVKEKVFEQCGKVKSATIAKKKDIKNPEFKNKRGVEKAMRELQHTVLDGHTLELKISNRSTLQPKSSKKPEKTKLQDISTKILLKRSIF
ncbi:hypothetical protein KUTeg_010261 [Tegillarca granosa]|uniref:RRM domain-containing protein n=1 Tax=Tegillarca granosa TaxID=220873 RepID=A0ABQ9F6A2_TEGGR|nr:hypothetical protein KUTeg_010261 [Tegillarca granosa]